jgi:hypothetical protein
VEADLFSADRPITPLERGAPRLVSVCPERRSTVCKTITCLHVISSQTGDPGAPETTDAQPFGGGPSRELNYIIGELGDAGTPVFVERTGALSRSV